MVEMTKKLVAELEEFIELLIKGSISTHSLKNMGEVEMAELKKGLELLDSAKKLVVEEAETLERIEGKLDKLLLKEKKEK